MINEKRSIFSHIGQEIKPLTKNTTTMSTKTSLRDTAQPIKILIHVESDGTKALKEVFLKYIILPPNFTESKLNDLDKFVQRINKLMGKDLSQVKGQLGNIVRKRIESIEVRSLSYSSTGKDGVGSKTGLCTDEELTSALVWLNSHGWAAGDNLEVVLVPKPKVNSVSST